MGVLTAPLALIKVNGITVGRMRNIRCTETIRRGRVSGIGEITAHELPALEWNGTLTCQYYTIKFDTTGLPNAIKRKASSPQQFIDNVLLQEEGVDVTILKKVKDSINPTTGMIETTFEEFATITGAFIDRESFDISEGQISGQDQDLTYINPIIYDI